MATLQAGYVYGATETVTNAKLAALVNNGGVTNIAQTDIVSSEGLVHTGTVAPTDTDQLWIDTSATPVIVRFYNSTMSAWVSSTELAIYTNKSGQTGSAGRVLILDTTNSNSYKYTSTAGDTKFLGIETASVASNASAPIVSRGSATITLEISASAGTYIRTSTATGKAEPTVNSSQGVFGFLTESGTASARGTIFGVQVNPSNAYTASASNALSGSVIQMVNFQTGAVATGTTVMPDDDTIPQNTEGTQFMTKSITPTNASNLLRIEIILYQDFSVGSGATKTAALFQDSTANALAAGAHTLGSSSGINPIVFTHWMTAGTTSSTTFNVRAGGDTAGTMTFNGTATARLYGGVIASSITITEIKA